jgi:hypothetical protein
VSRDRATMKARQPSPERLAMDLATIDARYADLERESAQTVTSLQALAQKLQTEAANGNAQAREWLLDLKEVAIGLRDEQSQTRALLQALHDFVVNEMPAGGGAPAFQQPQFAPPPQQYAQPQQPQYVQPQQPQYVQQQAQGGGGLMSMFTGGGFGRALGMGAAFGVGDALISDLFN